MLHFDVNTAHSLTAHPQLPKPVLRSSYVSVASRDGELVEPLVVVYYAFDVLAGDQLRAQHPPGQVQVHHVLHCRGPVVQGHQT